MAATITRQFRPPSTSETSELDALSVRTLVDLAQGMNNAKNYVFAHKIRSIICFPPHNFATVDSSTDEDVRIVMLLPKIAPLFKYIRWEIGHYVTNASKIVTWRLYCSDRLYTGPDVMDTDYLGEYDSDSFTSSSTKHDRANARQQDNKRDSNEYN